jgi:uncharacterized damage-inducible protein DinB
MLQAHLTEIFDRELEKLLNEITSYQNPDHLWSKLPGTTNSGGNLALHLAGNLRHFIGAELGGTGYVRNRDLEFNSPPVALELLQKLIGETRAEVALGLSKVSDQGMDDTFPKEIGGQTRTTRFVLLHLLSHFTYHLGQLNYHRRYYSSTG